MRTPRGLLTYCSNVDFGDSWAETRRTIEGPIADADKFSFTAYYAIPVRYGMTIGELALYFEQEINIKCPLEIVRMENWDRSTFFEETGLPWVLPSPNMPTIVHDLPGGGPRFQQTASGFLGTIVAGELVHSGGEHTGKYPGRLIRGPLAHT